MGTASATRDTNTAAMRNDAKPPRIAASAHIRPNTSEDIRSSICAQSPCSSWRFYLFKIKRQPRESFIKDETATKCDPYVRCGVINGSEGATDPESAGPAVKPVLRHNRTCGRPNGCRDAGHKDSR